LPQRVPPSLRFLQERPELLEGMRHPTVLVMPSEIKSVGHPQAWP